MARRGSSFSTMVGRGLKAAAREAKRQHKQAIREEAIRQKEYQKQRILDEKISKIEQACKVTVQVESELLDYLSLKHPLNKLITSSEFEQFLIEFDDDEVLEICIDYLKKGERLETIEYLKSETDLKYNDIIKIVLYIEVNLNILLKDNESCWFDDPEGEYEFLPSEEIFDIDVDIDDETAKAEVIIECLPTETQEIISSKDPAVIQNRINNVITKLNTKWLAQLRKYHETRENNIIQEIKAEFNTILEYGLNTKQIRFCWEELYDNSEFNSKLKVISKPALSLINIEEIRNEISIIDNKKPVFEDFKYNIIDSLLLRTPLNKRIIEKREAKFQKAINNWSILREQKLEEINIKVSNAEKENKQKQIGYDKKLQNYNKYLSDLEIEKQEFFEKQHAYNKEIEDKIDRFKKGNSREIEEYYTNSLELSVYPFLIEKQIGISYNTDNKMMVINYSIPSLDDIYNISKIDYLSSKKTFSSSVLSQKDLNQLYNDAIYQVCLRTIYEVFELNKNSNNQIDVVVFNGVLSYLDKSVGKQKEACIISLQATKEIFAEINLSEVSPKECFKSLKGVGAAELSSLTPVMPIQRFDKNDKRFVDSYEVLETIDNGTNLAAIHWQDFENLIREVFGKEFSQNGGEVKITQASRDGGVDAIAFDPDPIRGGKIVIQAKRYTNTVGISAVRDLYGTLMNEGANSGILVTTSDFGSDAYEFAKGKPINLLNGSELLYLMEKHGYKAYINLKEAKKIMANANEL